MSIEAEIYTKLSSTSSITALVSTRIYPTLAPEGVTGDFITYHKVNANTERHLSGVSNLRSATFDFYSWSSTALGAVTIADAIHDALLMKQFGTSCVVSGSDLQFMVSFYEAESRLHRVAVSITFYYSV